MENKHKLWLSAVCCLLAARCAAAQEKAAPVTPPPAETTDITTLPDFSLAPGDMTAVHEKARAKLTAALDAVAAIAPEAGTFADTVSAVENSYADFHNAVSPATFMAQVSPDKTTRDRAHDLELEINREMVEFNTREDVYKAIKSYAARNETLPGEDKKLLADMLLNFHRNGLDLPAGKREEFKTLLKRLSELELNFGNNVKDDAATLEAKTADLKGVSEDFLKDLKSRGRDGVSIPLDYPHYSVLMETAENPAVRAAAEFKFNNKAAGRNLPLLKEALEKRRKLAGMLGYPSYAHYVLDYHHMAKDPKRVNDFLERLRGLLADGARADMNALLELKRRDIQGAKSLDNSDITGLIGRQLGYYQSKYMKQKYAIDSEEIRAYFPVGRVIGETLAIFQELLGVIFKEIPVKTKPDAAGPANAWHPEVRLFEVCDTQTGRLLAHFYLDLYPREGKYNHMAAFDVIAGRALPTGGYRLPIAAMVGNFTKSTADKPALMTHDELETFFHEFGHIMHQTLTRAGYASFAGSNVARDFVEAPSQMLENFVWAPVVLNRISGHYKNQANKLPRDLLDKMLAARHALSALSNLRLIALSALDMKFHGEKEAKDLAAVTKSVFVETGYLTPTPGTHFEARFGHVMEGYAAGYYGYLWSRVFAQDIYSRFEAAGVLSPEAGMDYRKTILERGSSVDEDQSLKEFLKREPDEKAFMQSLGFVNPNPAVLRLRSGW